MDRPGRRLRGDPRRREGLSARRRHRAASRRDLGSAAADALDGSSVAGEVPRSEAQRSVSVPSDVAERKTSWSGPPSAGSATKSRTRDVAGLLDRLVLRCPPAPEPLGEAAPQRLRGGHPHPAPELGSKHRVPGDSETRSVPSPPVTTDQPGGTWSSPDGRSARRRHRPRRTARGAGCACSRRSLRRPPRSRSAPRGDSAPIHRLGSSGGARTTAASGWQRSSPRSPSCTNPRTSRPCRCSATVSRGCPSPDRGCGAR